MSLPVCPKCRSTAVSPNRWSAGEDVCGRCGHIGPVAHFHQERPLAALKRGQKWPSRAKVEIRHHTRASARPEPSPRFWWVDR